MRHQPDTVLVVVDILENLRVRLPGANQYEEETRTMQGLSQFAGRHNIGVIAIHHTRKAKANHVFNEISGTTGLLGGTDTMLVIANEPQSSMLYIRGRDIEDDRPLPIRWDGYLRMWGIIDQMDLFGDTRRDILSLIADSGEPLSIQDMCNLMPEVKKATMQSTLQRMVKDGQIIRTARGRYDVPEEEKA
jgi:Holliday junction resolvasome RuvABC ATP-dependent DNA helicase subunit